MYYNTIAKLKFCTEGKVLVFPDPFPIHIEMLYFSFLIYRKIKDRKVLVDCWCGDLETFRSYLTRPFLTATRVQIPLWTHIVYSSKAIF